MHFLWGTRVLREVLDDNHLVLPNFPGPHLPTFAVPVPIRRTRHHHGRARTPRLLPPPPLCTPLSPSATSNLCNSLALRSSCKPRPIADCVCIGGSTCGVKSFPASSLVLDRTRHPRFCFHLFVAFKCWVGLVYSSDAGASPRFLLFWAISRYEVSLLSGFLIKRFLNFRVTGGKWISV
jgi:hypothetical protein